MNHALQAVTYKIGDVWYSSFCPSLALKMENNAYYVILTPIIILTIPYLMIFSLCSIVPSAGCRKCDVQKNVTYSLTPVVGSVTGNYTLQDVHTTHAFT
jgi:hypothetical protein